MSIIKKRRAVSLSLIAIMFFSASCASPAMEAIGRAHSAIKNAREAQAEKYAPVEMALAVAAFDLAETSIMERTAAGNKLARKYAEEADNKAVSAKQKAEIALQEEKLRPPPAPPIIIPEPTVPEDPAILKKRYIAQARRRILNSALTDSNGKITKGRMELEAWIAPDGKVVQILLVEGDPTSPLTQQILKNLSTIRMEPFPAGMTEDYLKVRVKIDTTGEHGRN